MEKVIIRKLNDSKLSAEETINKRKGFTLVEVIVVLLILAILGGIAVPSLTGYINDAKIRKNVAEAREYRQTITAMQVMILGESGKTLWSMKRDANCRTYYLMPSNTQIGGKDYRILHITCESPYTGTKKYKELTGRSLSNRFFNDIRNGSFPGYFVVNKNSEIVAGWYLTEDTDSLITWGIKKRPERTYYNSTNWVVSGGSEETLTTSDIDPSVSYVFYKRKSGTKVFESV